MSSPRRLQAGYLMEAPLVMAGAGILVAMFLPKQSGIPGKVLLVAAAVVWIAGLYSCW